MTLTSRVAVTGVFGDAGGTWTGFVGKFWVTTGAMAASWYPRLGWAWKANNRPGNPFRRNPAMGVEPTTPTAAKTPFILPRKLHGRLPARTGRGIIAAPRPEGPPMDCRNEPGTLRLRPPTPAPDLDKDHEGGADRGAAAGDRRLRLPDR